MRSPRIVWSRLSIARMIRVTASAVSDFLRRWGAPCPLPRLS